MTCTTSKREGRSKEQFRGERRRKGVMKGGRKGEGEREAGDKETKKL